MSYVKYSNYNYYLSIPVKSICINFTYFLQILRTPAKKGWSRSEVNSADLQHSLHLYSVSCTYNNIFLLSQSMYSPGSFWAYSRLYCVGGCWDRTQDCCAYGIIIKKNGKQMLSFHFGLDVFFQFEAKVRQCHCGKHLVVSPNLE